MDTCKTARDTLSLLTSRRFGEVNLCVQQQSHTLPRRGNFLTLNFSNLFPEEPINSALKECDQHTHTSIMMTAPHCWFYWEVHPAQLPAALRLSCTLLHPPHPWLIPAPPGRPAHQMETLHGKQALKGCLYSSPTQVLSGGQPAIKRLVSWGR